jgi:hypothetical protein
MWSLLLLQARPHDLFFVGQMRYKKSPAIQRHRELAVAALKAIKAKRKGLLDVVVKEGSKAFDHHSYLKMLQDTKVGRRKNEGGIRKTILWIRKAGLVGLRRLCVSAGKWM